RAAPAVRAAAATRGDVAVVHSKVARATSAKLRPRAGFATPKGTMQAAAVAALISTGMWPSPTQAGERLARAATEVNIAAIAQDRTAAPAATSGSGRSDRLIEAVKNAPATGATNWLARRTLGAKRTTLASTKSM